jgi:hypothetical protein
MASNDLFFPRSASGLLRRRTARGDRPAARSKKLCFAFHLEKKKNILMVGTVHTYTLLVWSEDQPEHSTSSDIDNPHHSLRFAYMAR